MNEIESMHTFAFEETDKVSKTLYYELVKRGIIDIFVNKKIKKKDVKFQAVIPFGCIYSNRIEFYYILEKPITDYAVVNYGTEEVFIFRKGKVTRKKLKDFLKDE